MRFIMPELHIALIRVYSDADRSLLESLNRPHKYVTKADNSLYAITKACNVIGQNLYYQIIARENFEFIPKGFQKNTDLYDKTQDAYFRIKGETNG